MPRFGFSSIVKVNKRIGGKDCSFHWWICALVILTVQIASAQIGNPTTESGLKPYGSYHGGDIDTIALFNGKLDLHIPLVSWPQRGNLKFGFTIRYDSPRYTETKDGPPCGTPGNPCYYESNFDGAGVVVQPDFGYGIYKQDVFYANADRGYVYAIVSPDGSSHQVGGGRSLDGTGFHWDLNGIITDKEGTRYYIPSSSDEYIPGVLPYGGVSKVEDTSGNQITASGSTYLYGSTGYTDSLGRIIPAPTTTTDYSSCTGTLPISSAKLWQVPGPQGGTVSYKFCYALLSLNFNLSSGLYHLPYTGTVSMLQSIVLPNGTAWTFRYAGSNGMLNQITLPTGGTISYGGGPRQVCGNGVYPLTFASKYSSRSVDANDGNGPKSWTYQSAPVFCPTSTTVTDPLGNQTVHTFTNLNSTNSAYETQTQYESGSTSLLKTVTTNYTWTANTTLADGYSSVINVVPTVITTTWPLPGGGTKVSKVEKDYDAGFSFTDLIGTQFTGIHYGNVITERDYDYGSGAPGPLLRRTVTGYQAFNLSPYLTYNLLDAVSSVAIYDSTANTCKGASTYCAYTWNGYDESTPAGSGIATQHNSSPVNGNTRGNQTSVHRWLNGSTTATTNCSAVTGGYLITSRAFYDTGMVHTSSDPCGHVTTSQYSSTYAGAYPTTVTNALGQNTTFQYDFDTGLQTSIADPNLQATTSAYDNMFRLTQVNYPDGGQTTYCYTDEGGSGCTQSGPPYHVVVTTKIVSSLNKVSTLVVDGLARLTQTQLSSAPDGVIYVDTTYDADGRKSTVSNPHRSGTAPTDGVTTYGYDGLSRTTSVQEADGSNILTSYAGTCTTVTDETGKARQSCADGLGRMTGVWEDPSGANYETDYQYDALGNLTQVQQKGGDPNSADWRTRNFVYNSLSQVMSSSNPESGVIGYTYDANGNLATKQAPAPNQTVSGTVTTNYAYDLLDRLTGKNYAGMSTAGATYGYDGGAPSGCTPPTFVWSPNVGQLPTYQIGRRTSMCDASGATSWGYDSMGRLEIEQRVINGVNKNTVYEYTLDGQLGHTFYPSGNRVDFEVDAAGRNYGVVDEINNYVFGNVLFAPNGAVMQANLSANSPAPFGGVQIYNFYNKRQQLAASYATWQPVLYGPSWSFISKHCYDYHVNGGGTFGDDNFTCTFSNTSPADNGNIYQITNGIDGNRTQNFSYDSLNRISQAYTSGPNWGETFTMDAWGNLTNKGPVAGKTNYENFNAPALVNNRLTGYSYDAAGNVLRDAMNNALTYDAENRIAQVGSNLSYTYDGDGQRVKKSSGTIYWSGTDGNALAESDLSGNINEEYIYFDGQRVARVDRPSGTVHYYVSDPLGSARIVADPTGVIGESDYYPYGGEIPITGSIGKYKFTGKERDSESGLDEFGARYYGSSLGRFMTPDWDMKPVTVPYAKFGDPQTLNLYSYVENEPINRIDPDGHTNPPGQEGINACAGSTTCVDAQKQDAAAQNQAAVAAVPTAMEEINAVVQPLVQSAEGALSKAGTTLLDVGADALLVGAYLVSPGSGGANNSNDTIQGHESSGSPEPQAAAGGAGARGRDPKRFFSAKDKQGLAAEAGNKCAICGGPTTPAQRSQRGVTPAGSEAQTDHKTPWSKGGATVRSNGQHVCRTCNINKGDD